MKRRILALLGALLILLLPAAALAEGAGSYDLVIDNAGLMSAEQVSTLNRKAWELSNQDGLEMVVLTTNGTGGKSIQDFAADFYDNNGYGTGPNHDGVMFAIDMAERDWYILTTGSAIRIFTDYGIQTIGNDVRPFLSNGNYYQGFDRFLQLADRFVRQAVEGNPYDINNEFQGEPMTLAQKLGAALPIGLVASALATLFGMGGLKKGMHTAVRKHGAAQYARENSMQMTRHADVFLYHTQHRERMPDPSEHRGGGGGSTTFHSSSGTTHGGGGGKF